MLERASDTCLCPHAHQRRYNLQHDFGRDSNWLVLLASKEHAEVLTYSDPLLRRFEGGPG